MHFLIEVLVFSSEIPLCASEKGNNFHIYGWFTLIEWKYIVNLAFSDNAAYFNAEKRVKNGSYLDTFVKVQLPPQPY